MCSSDLSYGIDNKIYCKWAFYKWSIDLEAISEVYYAVEPTGSETRTIHNLSIIFIDQSNAKKKLYSKVLAGDVAKCIAGQSDELPLMELYRFAESRYPEKAKGYYDGGRK